MSSIYIRQGRRRCRTMKVNFPRCLDCCRRICQLILFRRIFVVLKRKFKPIVSYCFLLQFNKHSVTSRSENFNDVGGKERWVDEDIFVYLFLLPIMTCDQTFVDGHVPVQPLNNGQFSSVRETFSLVRRNSSLPRWWASVISTTQRVQVCRDCSRRVGGRREKISRDDRNLCENTTAPHSRSQSRTEKYHIICDIFGGYNLFQCQREHHRLCCLLFVLCGEMSTFFVLTALARASSAWNLDEFRTWLFGLCKQSRSSIVSDFCRAIWTFPTFSTVKSGEINSQRACFRQ